jgi:predicted transcriptional regulator
MWAQHREGIVAETVEITVRVPSRLQSQLDAIADAFDRPRSWVVERALEAFVEIEDVKKAIAEADAGEFASEAEVEAFFTKWRPDANDAG